MLTRLAQIVLFAHGAQCLVGRQAAIQAAPGSITSKRRLSPAPTRNRRSAVAQVLLRLPLEDYEPPAGYRVIFRQGSVQGLL
jgi:hypothetical protein